MKTIALFLLLPFGLASAQFVPQPPAPKPGEVLVRLQDGNPRVGRLLERKDDEIILSTSLAGGSSTLRIPVSAISEILAPLPDGITSASSLWRTGKLEAAAKEFAAHLPASTRLYPVVPDNLAEAIVAYADTLRQLGNYEEALKWLQTAGGKLSGDALLRADCIKAISLARMGQIEDARTLLARLRQPGNSEPAFPLFCLARAALSDETDQPIDAAESLGRAMALTPLSSPQYPEALYQALRTYQWLETGRRTGTNAGSPVGIENEGSPIIRGSSASRSIEEQMKLLYPEHYWTLQWAALKSSTTEKSSKAKP